MAEARVQIERAPLIKELDQEVILVVFLSFVRCSRQLPNRALFIFNYTVKLDFLYYLLEILQIEVILLLVPHTSRLH